MALFHSIVARMQHMVVFLGRSRARQVLLGMSDRQLQDMGFCRDLLNEGVAAWPWGVADEAPEARLSHLLHTERQAVVELRQCSDKELADLGLARSTIEDAVRDGRPGIDDELTHRDVAQRAA